jgi:enoyl-CoA hydratase
MPFMKLERLDGVALLRMDLGKANAIGPAFLDALNARLDELGDARALVITGYDTFFSAGLDLPSLIDLDAAAIRGFISRFSATMARVFALPLPVVAAVNGHAVAGGCVLMTQADVVYAVESGAKIGLNEVPLGIGLPAVVIETLRCKVPPPSLVPIALEGRLLAPAEARALGLVDELHPAATLVEKAVTRAQAMAALPPVAFASVKRSLRTPALDAIERAGANDARLWTDTWNSPDGQARLRAAVARLKK